MAKNERDVVVEACAVIIHEYVRASDMFPPFNSAHEGYAVILEELDELKAEVWKNPASRDAAKLIKEAVHVAAMALRFIVDLCPFEIAEVRTPAPPEE